MALVEASSHSRETKLRGFETCRQGRCAELGCAWKRTRREDEDKTADDRIAHAQSLGGNSHAAP